METRSRSYDSPKAVQVARSGPFSSDFHWCTRLTHFYTFRSETHFHVTWGCHGLFWRVGWPVTCFAKYICDEGHRTPNLCGLKIVLCVRIFLEPKNLHALLPEYHHVSLKAHFLHTMMILIKIPCFFSIRAEESPRNIWHHSLISDIRDMRLQNIILVLIFEALTCRLHLILSIFEDDIVEIPRVAWASNSSFAAKNLNFNLCTVPCLAISR